METIEDALATLPPLPGNRCVGTRDDGTQYRHFKCVKSVDTEGNKVYTCTTKRLFRVSCPKLNRLCNARSEAYVAAVTVCNQRLF